MAAYKYDIHVHTIESSPCGMVPAAEMVRLYSEAGYSGIVVTDHFYKHIFDMHFLKKRDRKTDKFLKGYRAAVEAGKHYDLDVILGVEITFEENLNDYLVYGIDEQFLTEYNKGTCRLGLEGFRKLIAGRNMLIFQAHPFRPNMIPASPALIDGIEVYNGNARHDSRNELAMEYARENGLMMSSGSDFHRLGDQARGGIIVPQRIRNSSELVSAFKEKRIENLIQT